MHKFFKIFLILVVVTGCSNSDSKKIDIPYSSEVEDLILHSEEFEQKVLSYDTPGGLIHFAIGFGIANSIMVEGNGGNIIIDAADSMYGRKRSITYSNKKIQIQLKRLFTLITMEIILLEHNIILIFKKKGHKLLLMKILTFMFKE